MDCQKGVIQKWLSILIWKPIWKTNWPKRQHLHATPITITPASTAITATTPTTTTTTITKTTTYVTSTSKAEHIETNIWKTMRGKLN